MNKSERQDQARGSGARIYFLPNLKSCTQTCSYCPGLGSQSENKSLSDLSQSIKKAVNANYTEILLPCNSLFRPDADELIQKALAGHLPIRLQVNSRTLNPRLWDTLTDLYNQGLRFQLLIDQLDSLTLKNLKTFDEKFLDSNFVLIGRRDFDLGGALLTLPRACLSRSYIHFPLKLQMKDPYLSTNEVQETLELIERLLPEFKNRSYPGLDVFDPRISADTELEPQLSVRTLAQTNKKELALSVIVPTYNNRDYILNTLRHLSLQDLEAHRFEVILVDDGSSDGTEAALESFASALQGRINLKYIYFPRKKDRQMGDGDFRAGIARNIGVKASSGERLCFLDSDILTPPNFLNQILLDLQDGDLVQARRLYLKKEISSVGTNYQEVDKARDTYIPEGGYWHQFYSESTPWNQRPVKWKYVCTYTLALSRELFLKAGWFRKNYHYYGFEDTDLGYRCVQLGAKLKLSEAEVLHLFHEDQRSEYKNSAIRRHLLLKKTAKIFFHNNLQTEIYRNLRNLVSESGLTEVIKKSVRRKLNPQLWEKTLNSVRGLDL